MNHARCDRARREGGNFYCARCGERLAVGFRMNEIRQHLPVDPDVLIEKVTLQGDLGPLPARHDDMSAYGLGQRQRSRHKDHRWDSGSALFRGRANLPIYVYCTRTGCGKGQHLEI